MTPSQFAAQAILVWLEEKQSPPVDVAKDGLPKLDVPYFLKGIAQLKSLDPSRYSIALVGFDVGESELVQIASRSGLGSLRAVSDDLHSAADWRNKRKKYGNIIALAYGRHPGVHTLRHFACPSSHDLACALLNWASTTDRFAKIPTQKQLLIELANNASLSSLRSLDSVTRFLATWDLGIARDELDAPRLALIELGLLYDPQLFSGGQIANRLTRNLDVSEQVREMPGSNLRDRRKRIEKYPSPAQKTALLQLLEKLEAFRNPKTTKPKLLISLDEVQELLALPEAEIPKDESVPTDESDQEHDDATDDSGSESPSKLRDRSVNALLDGDDETLCAVSDGIENAWKEFEPDQENEVTGAYQVKGEQHSFSLPLDASFLKWLEYFCTEETWGGLIESSAPTLHLALASYEDADSILISPDTIITKDGQQISVERLCEDWDSGLQEEGFGALQIADTWRRFRSARMRLVPHIRMLVFNPLEWLPGRATILSEIDEYLSLSATLYEKVQKNYGVMAGVDDGWARALLEALLSLDILQVRISMHSNKVANKAVMLPLHPLHLWRYQRLTQVLRGLGATITDADRKAILLDVRRPEQFLSVILLGTIPQGKGANQILPVSNELHGLATFENLINAYSGSDGIETLIYSIGRYATLFRHHARPLRVVIVNPPEPDRLLTEVVRFMNSSAFRQPASLPSLRIELFATPQHSGRLDAAMQLDESVRDLVQDKLSSGRLQLSVREIPTELPALLQEIQLRPCHILVIFDEASIRIRRRAAGRMLPMSPFCVRQRIRLDRFEDRIRLEPSEGEPPFSEFMQLVNEADNSQRDSTPLAWADAESLRETIDSFIQPDLPAAQWILIADRALPSEGGLKAVRLLQRRNGQRQVLLATKDYQRIAELLRPAFDKCNLVLSSGEMESLLDEGVNLIGSGLLELIQTRDGRADAKKVLGLVGTLLAARHVRQHQPDAIIVSVDQELARLWLRIGSATNLDRSDLIAVHFDGVQFQVKAIEVKTTSDNNIAPTIIAHAVVQVMSTLAALVEAVPSDEVGSVLSAPRNEMLKEVLVRGCQGRGVPPDVRRTWGLWLRQLFRQDDSKSTATVTFSGKIVKVLMSSNETSPPERFCETPFPVFVDTLSEGEIQKLIQLKALGPSVAVSVKKDSEDSDSLQKRELQGTAIPEDKTGDNARDSAASASKGAWPVRQSESEQAPDQRNEKAFRSKTELISGSQGSPREGNGAVPQNANEGTDGDRWPPVVNSFGMIGQEEAVKILNAQAHFAKTFNERFTDKLLVGPAGVGKSSLARGIANMLLNEEALFINGSDLKEPNLIVELLHKAKKLPSNLKVEPIVAKKCLIFIDEVHAIRPNVATALLSALDDARLTSIDRKTYDFRNVIFVLATTDPGKLSEAFNSRPDKTWLRPYTLLELAGIVWHHGRECLNGYELSKETCLEIAARVRCNPRRAVRSLKDSLRPHFLSKLQIETGSPSTLREIGAAMTQDAVAAYYDAQRIDPNGLDDTSVNFLRYLHQNGATSEQRLRQALGISNVGDFNEIDEYLCRLQLIEIGSSGRMLTRGGKKYITSGAISLRHLISRQRII